ncbi:MAG: tetratricopeptide repeat protein [Desulfobacterales bacterium]|nr:tetratricopeptide repeat protein [Desulfobacterales bacterium]
MRSEQKGRLVLKAVPNKDVEEKVVSYLSGMVKGTTPELITEKVRKAPIILKKDISAEQGWKIVEALQRLGAAAVFIPHEAESAPMKEEPAVESRGPTVYKTSLPEPGSSPSPAPPAKQRPTNRLRLILFLILLIVSASVLIWQYYPSLDLRKKIYEKEKMSVEKPEIARIDFSAYRPYNEKSPSTMAVAPHDMYQAFLHQYRLRPDNRIIKAFEILTERFGEHLGGPQGQSEYRVGEILSNGKEVIVPLFKKKEKVAEVRMPLPITFSQAIAAFNEWLEDMEKGTPPTEVKIVRGGLLGTLENAEASINMIDPRSIIVGLRQLEDLLQKAGPDARLFRSAARGYALLLLVLHPDRMEYTDNFAAHALSFLALARRLDPKLSVTREEALLAMNMGYTAHAQNLLQSSFEGSPDPIDKILDAYMREDVEALKKLQGEGSRVLSYYLLARLYRKLRLFNEATKVTIELLQRFPTLYPAAVEMIYSGDLGSAKILTVLYPMDILARLEHEVDPKAFKDEKSWKERMKGFSGEQSAGNISLNQFEIMLERWRPFGKGGERGFFIDEKRVKAIFRTLYCDAVFMRFNLLLNRWAVLEYAENYVNLLAGEDKNHPLVMEMLAELYVEIGKRKEADGVCANAIRHPNVSGGLAGRAFYQVEDVLSQISLAPLVAQKVDGRPEGLFYMGTIFQRLWNLDLAEKFYALGLSQNPYKYHIYKYLCQVTGSDEPFLSALTNFPYSFTLMEEAAHYFGEKEELASKERALEYYEKALKVAPTRDSLHEDKAKLLRKLNRHDEAVQVLRGWIEKNEKRGGLTLTFFKTQLAKAYLEMKKSKLALDTIAEEIASYQAGAMMVGGTVYEELKKFDKAEETYLKAVGRYPKVDHVLSGTAAFLWRQGRYDEAAKMIAQGRSSMGRFSQWYFDDFLGVFASAPEERAMDAVNLLIKHGATHWEIGSLAFFFERRKRPEVAYKILQAASGLPQTSMERLEKSVDIYKVLRNWKGKEEALKYLQNAVPSEMRGPLTMVLFKVGLFDLILTELNNPKKYPSQYKEFLWLQRLIAWLALEKKPDDLEKEMPGHYKERGLQSIDPNDPAGYYYGVGCYLLGIISRDQLLSLIVTPKQRCEFAYYIGLSERLKGNFSEVTIWYHLCRETLLQNNGEFHWASNEMIWWTYLGVKDRHRLVNEDLEKIRKMGKIS